ncbi:hypothetical protein L3Q82_008138 [Scortum barcoo]|uniref:Uncharacterized protein n=1 Tax=Scortum barcoo TaxID=214431 RepID=A0ACB8WHD1_9TELE|nr:hypothetical protein L3Q82_008138 [Scortum barcoo]
MSHREEGPGKTQDTLERLCLSAGLGTPRGPPEELEEVSGDFQLNRVVMEEGAGAEPSPAGARPKKKNRKTYDLTAADKFWQKHKGSPFPEVAESVQEELDTYRAQEDEVKRLKSIMGLEGEDEGAISMLSDNTAKLTSAVSSLPELLEKKRLIDLHTNVATAVLDHIKSRKLDVYFEYEEKLMSKSTLDKSLLDIISDPDAGTPEDKMRLFLIYYITAQQAPSESDLEQYKTALLDAGCDLSPLNYIKQWKAFTKMAATPANYGNSGVKPMGLFSRVMNTGSQFVMEGVKNLVLKQHNLPVTRILDNLMEMKSHPETDDYRYFDPKMLRGSESSIPRNKNPFQEAIVFVVGGGNYIEYQNLVDYAKFKQGKKVVYGCSELFSAAQFIKQIKEVQNIQSDRQESCEVEDVESKLKNSIFSSMKMSTSPVSVKAFKKCPPVLLLHSSPRHFLRPSHFTSCMLGAGQAEFLPAAAGLPVYLHTGLSFLISSTSASESSVPYPVTCVTRGADLLEDGVVVLCPPDCTQWRVSVFGTGIYASVSSVCGAAVHRGVLGSSGGPVQVHKLQGRHSYMSSYANGIQSQALAHWAASFSLTKPVNVPLELTSEISTTPLPGGAQPGKKPLKKPSVKKALAGGNKDCQMDIALVIDSSKNIGQRRFNLQKNFVAKLSAMLRVGQTGPHIGLIQASDSPKTEIFLKNYTQPKELMFAIKELSYLGGETNTGKAIKHTAETFFTQENGGRRGHPRVMMVLIDGWPSDDLDQAAMLARESGINVFLVSVAKPAPEELSMVRDKEFMKKAVCKDNGFFSYVIPSWFSTTKHVKPLSQRLCSLDGLLCTDFVTNCLSSCSIHPSSSAWSGTGSRRQQSEQRCPDFPHPRHFLQLFRGDPEAFPGQPRDIVSPACPGSSPGSPPWWDMPGTPP